MLLYLIRHAHALDADDDAARPLSRRGREQVRGLAQFLQTSGAFQPERVWHSPLVRARETAVLLSRRLELPAPLAEMPDLQPEDDPIATARRLKLVTYPLAIVGHEPHLSTLASLLVAGAAHPPMFVVKKCAMIALEKSGQRWAVRWQVSPEVLG